METFYIFGFGVLSTLVVSAVIYSVLVISKLKKDVDEVLGELEDLQQNISSVEGYAEVEVQKINNKISSEIKIFDTTITNLLSTLENKLREVDSDILDIKETKK